MAKIGIMSLTIWAMRRVWPGLEKFKKPQNRVSNFVKD
jgi:hypothetical protein